MRTHTPKRKVVKEQEEDNPHDENQDDDPDGPEEVLAHVRAQLVSLEAMTYLAIQLLDEMPFIRGDDGRELHASRRIHGLVEALHEKVTGALEVADRCF